MINLFPDQIKFKEDIRLTLKTDNKILACAATGFGKSKTFISIGLDALSKGKTLLVLTESIKIFDQIKSELEAGLIDANSSIEFIHRNKAYIAMAQTLNNRQELIKQFAELEKDLLIICDEAHMGHFNKLLDQLTNCYLIGFSATPDARWSPHLPVYYSNIVVGPQPHELILMGRLTGYRHFARVGADFNKLVIKNGDFTEASQDAAFGNSKVFSGLIEDLKNTIFDKAMIYTSSVKLCNIVADEINKSGLKCVALHKNSKKFKCSDEEYERRLKLFQPEINKMPLSEGEELNIAVSVGTMTKGYDYDRIDFIGLVRATTSLPLYLQMNGRGGRVLEGEFSLSIDRRKKQKFNTFDYGNNWLRFGLWDAERDWHNLWKQPKKSKEGVAPVKMCPVCEFITNVSSPICPNCGYEFEKKDIPFEVGELIEITELYSDIVKSRKKISELTPKELAIYSKLKEKRNFGARVARTLEIDHPGYLELYSKEMGYKEGWVDWQKKQIDSGNIENGFTNFVITG